MKLRRLSLLLAVTAGLASMTAQAATQGNLNFAGQVNAGTCNLASGDQNRTVTMPTVKISDFDSIVYTGELDFDISAECESDIRNVTFEFSGTPSPKNNLLFHSTGTSGGTAIWLRSGLIITPSGPVEQRRRTVATSGGKAVLPLKAAYHVTGDPITQGTLVSTASVVITYN